MKVLLTGGSGDLGQTLMPRLLAKGDTPVILDIRAPEVARPGALFIQGSILDRPKLPGYFQGCDCIVHIAAWHGIHEVPGGKDAYDCLLYTSPGRHWHWPLVSRLWLARRNKHPQWRSGPYFAHSRRQRQETGRRSRQAAAFSWYSWSDSCYCGPFELFGWIRYLARSGRFSLAPMTAKL